MSGEDSNVMLQPGQLIRPVMTDVTARCLVEDLYGFKVTKIKELNSYDDKNYKIEVESEFNNPHIEKLWPHGYILKVLNSMDSCKNHIAAEHEAQHLLVAAGISCPLPVLDREGRDRSLQVIQPERNGDADNQPDSKSSRHIVRMLTFNPGDIIADYDVTPDLLTETGFYLARILRTLKDFSHPALTCHQTVWNLIETPRQAEFLYAVQEESRRTTVDEVLEAFSRTVIPNVDTFQKGIIHGDYNEQNILVNKTNNNVVSVCGVIDFGDMTQSYYVFDLAIAIMYMAVNCKKNTDPIRAGGHVLSGYLREMSLSNAEWRVLRVCVAARYCQSLVMGAYSYLQDPGNEYLLCTAKAGWDQLETFWRMSPEKLYNEWYSIIQEAEPGMSLPDLQEIL